MYSFHAWPEDFGNMAIQTDSQSAGCVPLVVRLERGSSSGVNCRIDFSPSAQPVQITRSRARFDFAQKLDRFGFVTRFAGL